MGPLNAHRLTWTNAVGKFSQPQFAMIRNYLIIHQFVNFKVSLTEPYLKVGMDGQLIVGHLFTYSKW